MATIRIVPTLCMAVTDTRVKEYHEKVVIEIDRHSHGFGQEFIKGSYQELLEENPDQQENGCPHTHSNKHIRILDGQDITKRIWKRSVELLATLIKMIPRAKKEEKGNADGGIAFDNRVSLDVGNDDGS